MDVCLASMWSLTLHEHSLFEFNVLHFSQVEAEKTPDRKVCLGF